MVDNGRKYLIDVDEWIDQSYWKNLPRYEAFRICLLYLFDINMYQMGETSREWSDEGAKHLDAMLERVCSWKGQYRKQLEKIEEKESIK